MSKHVGTVVFEYQRFDSPDELDREGKELLEAAQKASENAYAPYSRFQVGACVLLENGMRVQGNNQENVAYPSGLCAERVAIFAASAQNPGVPVKRIAIFASSALFKVEEPVSPCGACRQAMAEYEHLQDSPIQLILSSAGGGVYVINSVSSLLPLIFNERKLRKDT